MITQIANNGGISSVHVAEALAELSSELVKVIGLSASVSRIGKDLPVTVAESDDTVCPELVFPSLASSILEHANKSMLLLEGIQDALRVQSTTGGAA